MSAVPATSQVRRNAAAAPSRSSQQQQAPVRQAANAPQAFAFDAPSDDAEFHLNLSDIPPMESTMEVEGFKPSLLSRLFDLVSPYKR